MKTKTIITEITHDDLVNLLSTGIYGSEILMLDYNARTYERVKGERDDESIEDKCATLLLNGKSVTISDRFAEDESDFYGVLPHKWDKEYEVMDYKVTLDNIVSGLQRCLDGTFKINEGCDEEIAYMRKCMTNLIDADGDLDLYEAQNILQVIIFGQIIYG